MSEMAGDLSPRLRSIVDTLPLRPDMLVLEIGCGPGAAAREIARRIGTGYVLGIDRSAAAIRQAIGGSEAASRILRFRRIAAEDFEPEPGEAPFDLILAIRVGALDGRHPEAGRLAAKRLSRVISPSGALYVDGQRRSLEAYL